MVPVQKILSFYIDGFQSMRVGKKLWAIILLKLFLILTLFNYFVYDKSIKTEYKTDIQKSNFVYENLKGK